MGQSCTQSSNGAGWAGEALLAAAFGAAGTAPQTWILAVCSPGAFCSRSWRQWLLAAAFPPASSAVVTRGCSAGRGETGAALISAAPGGDGAGPRERGPESSTFFPNPYLENKEKVGGLRAAGAPGSG